MRMDEVNKIRKAYCIDGLTINEIAQKFKRSWATVNEIVKKSREEVENRDTPERKRESTVATQEVRDAITGYLEKEIRLGVKKKQRYRANVIFKELTEKGLYNGSQRHMQELVKEARGIFGQLELKSYLPLGFSLGSNLQMDHGEVDCVIAGFRSICYLFIASVPGTTLRYCQLFGTKAQEAWGEFHERCFLFFNGIFSQLTYDNDTVLIKDASKGQHIQTSFSLALCEHYGFQSVYCNPASGNEKGSVENGVGYCRRNYLPGCPTYPGFDQANKYLEQRCLEEVAKNRLSRSGSNTIETLEEVRKNLRPVLPARKWRQRDSRYVNRYQLVEVYNHFYSVPVKFVNCYVRVAIGAFNIEIYNKEELIHEHIRMFVPGSDSLLLDHYLDQLRKKPGALWDCKATKGVLDDKALEAIWERLYERNPLRKAQKDFIEILYLKKNYEEKDWRAAIDKAFECGAYDPTAIESIIRMLGTPNKNNEKAVLERLIHITIPTWECNLSEYATLSKEEVSNKTTSDLSNASVPKGIVLKPNVAGTSRHGNAMFGKWNGPIMDQIMDEYFLEKKNNQHSINEDKAMQRQPIPAPVDRARDFLEFAISSKGGHEC
jgi:transposase